MLSIIKLPDRSLAFISVLKNAKPPCPPTVEGLDFGYINNAGSSLPSSSRCWFLQINKKGQHCVTFTVLLSERLNLPY